jgi:hypothetical protein
MLQVEDPALIAKKSIAESAVDELTMKETLKLNLTVQTKEFKRNATQYFALDSDIITHGNISFFFDGVLDLGEHYLEASENIILKSLSGGYIIAESYLEMVAGRDIIIDVPLKIYRNTTSSDRRLIVEPTAIHTTFRANGSFNLSESIE